MLTTLKQNFQTLWNQSIHISRKLCGKFHNDTRMDIDKKDAKKTIRAKYLP